MTWSKLNKGYLHILSGFRKEEKENLQKNFNFRSSKKGSKVVLKGSQLFDDSYWITETNVTEIQVFCYYKRIVYFFV